MNDQPAEPNERQAVASTSLVCPRGQRTTVTGWARPPHETTYEHLGNERTFEPGLSADVTLACGCTIRGAEGVALLESINRRPTVEILDTETRVEGGQATTYLKGHGDRG